MGFDSVFNIKNMKSTFHLFCLMALTFFLGCKNSDPYGNESFEEVGGIVFHCLSEYSSENKEVLKKRIDNYTIGNYEYIDKEDEHFEVKISKSYYTSFVFELFSKGGEIRLGELMTRDEIEPYIISFELTKMDLNIIRVVSVSLLKMIKIKFMKF